MKLSNEAKIGILVIGVALVLGVITWKAGNFDFTPEGYHLKVLFKDIDGVALNAPVTLNGFEVGRVDDINIVYGDVSRVEVSLWIKEKYKVRKDAEAFVKNLGFMGEKYVGIKTGDKETGFFQPGETIQGREPGSFEKIMSEGEVIAVNLREITENVNERLRINSAAIDEIIADLRVSMNNIERITDNVNLRLVKNEALIDDFVFQMNSASRNLEDMSYDLKLNPWKLMYKEPKRLTPKEERQKKKDEKSDTSLEAERK